MCFHKESKFRICDIVVYIDDLNIIGTLKEILKVVDCLNKKEMNDLGKQSFVLACRSSI